MLRKQKINETWKPLPANTSDGRNTPQPGKSRNASSTPCWTPNETVADKRSRYCSSSNTRTSIRSAKAGTRRTCWSTTVFLKRIGATYFQTDRGGDITYHGLGQLVGYPILDLERLGTNLKDYIWTIEESVIRTIAEYGIAGGRLAGATGVWIEGDSPRARKICAIGVKASRYVTMHGFALNVTTDLRYFSYINPCGFVDKGVTSIEKETGMRPTLEEVARKFAAHFGQLLRCEVR